MVAHGAELLKLAPEIYRDLHTSLEKTANTTQSPGHTCYPHRADGVGSYTGCNFRSVTGWPHIVIRIEVRQALISYQGDHMLLLTLQVLPRDVLLRGADG